MKNPEQFASPLLKQYQNASVYTDVAFDARGRSKVQKRVDLACSAESEAILQIARNGSLDEKIALEYQLQLRDLEKYAKSSADLKNIKQGLKDLDAGLVAYTDLTERHEAYRKQALGYTDRNRDMKLDVPKDGMRYAIASQITRLQNRQSLQLSEEEKVLLAARRTLLGAIQDAYSALQVAVVHEAEVD